MTRQRNRRCEALLRSLTHSDTQGNVIDDVKPSYAVQDGTWGPPKDAKENVDDIFEKQPVSVRLPLFRPPPCVGCPSSAASLKSSDVSSAASLKMTPSWPASLNITPHFARRVQ